MGLLVFVAPNPIPRQYHGATDGVVLPTSSLVLQDDAIAAEVNPAMVGFLHTLDGSEPMALLPYDLAL